MCRSLDSAQPLSGRASQHGAKFGRWYEDTIESYRRIFRHDPPPDICAATVRFGNDLRVKRVNFARH